MKKMIPLILAVLLCFSLCACGKNTEAPLPPETQVPTRPSGSHISNHPLLDFLCGEWSLVTGGFQKPVSLSFSPDGVCMAQYSPDQDMPQTLELSWRVDEDSSSESLLRILINNHDRDVYIFELSPIDPDHCSARLTELYAQGMPDMWYDYYKSAGEHLDHKLQAILGEWILLEEDDAVPDSFIFLEDYTCIVDGTTYSWEYIPNSGAGDCMARVLNVPEYGNFDFMLTLREDRGEHLAYIYNINMSLYAKPDNWEIIDITPENLFDYYELVNKDFYFIKDEFGEYTRYSFTQRLALKEEYAGRDLIYGKGRTMIVMEISYSLYGQQVDVDIANLTGKFTGEPYLDSTSTRILSFTSDGCDIWSCLRDIGGAMLYYDDITILRAQGQLWLTKEN